MTMPRYLSYFYFFNLCYVLFRPHIPATNADFWSCTFLEEEEEECDPMSYDVAG